MPTLVFSKAHPTRQFHNAGSRRRYRQCARNSGGTTGNSCYTFISSKSAFGLDRTGLDWIGLDSTGSERPREISEAGTFHLFFSHRFFLPYRGMILRVLAERESGSQHFCIFFPSRLSQLTYSLLTVFQALAWVGAWVIGVVCTMESIGRSSADRYTFFSCRQLVQFFWSDEKALFSASHAYHYTICIVSHS